MMFIFLMHPTHDSTSMKHQRLVVDTNRMRGSNRIHDAPLDSAITKVDTSNDNDKHEVTAQYRYTSYIPSPRHNY